MMEVFSMRGSKYFQEVESFIWCISGFPQLPLSRGNDQHSNIHACQKEVNNLDHTCKHDLLCNTLQENLFPTATWRTKDAIDGTK